MATQKRISKELADIESSPPAGITINLADGADMFKWKVTMDGPTNSPYAAGTFSILLALPPTYPFKPPTVTFTTKIYHPNISNDSPPNTGQMCLGILKDTEWKPATKMVTVLEFIRQLLREPNVDDAVEAKIAEQYRDDRTGYEKEARDWTKRYAAVKK